MIRFVIALVVVVAIVLGGLLAFRRSRLPLPSQDVIDRVKRRERVLEEEERRERGD